MGIAARLNAEPHPCCLHVKLFLRPLGKHTTVYPAPGPLSPRHAPGPSAMHAKPRATCITPHLHPPPPSPCAPDCHVCPHRSPASRFKNGADAFFSLFLPVTIRPLENSLKPSTPSCIPISPVFSTGARSPHQIAPERCCPPLLNECHLLCAILQIKLGITSLPFTLGCRTFPESPPTTMRLLHHGTPPLQSGLAASSRICLHGESLPLQS
jgi:hypothetical protein